jgi:hypothetical protein
MPLPRRHLIGHRVSHHELRPSRKGMYVGELPPAQIDGVYRFEFSATGRSCGGTFDRYADASILIGRCASPGHTSIETSIDRSGLVTLMVIPRDEGGQLLGAGYGATIKLATSKARVMGVADQGDGSYRVLLRSSQRRPAGTLMIGGTRIPIPAPSSGESSRP